ncbi:NlpC/P60 family protein [Nonomuraea sp. 3-1Str]|uniref:C40 family peptidase n=1 Tax=Nonomuraea sp. 3-1Str TaxID=2929801 RepID=UPI002861AAD3|nr:NlpC/P60 family protein [Nonomuraea sp. 3-1Str]MDR8409907.1 NlpC/P60 family protein [Nonomuraea sp. 3-1Str]
MHPHPVSLLCRASLTIGGGLFAGLTVLPGPASATAPGPCFGTVTLSKTYARLLNDARLTGGLSRRPGRLGGTDQPILFAARPGSPARGQVRVIVALPPRACARRAPLTDALAHAGITLTHPLSTLVRPTWWPLWPYATPFSSHPSHASAAALTTPWKPYGQSGQEPFPRSSAPTDPLGRPHWSPLRNPRTATPPPTRPKTHPPTPPIPPNPAATDPALTLPPDSPATSLTLPPPLDEPVITPIPQPRTSTAPDHRGDSKRDGATPASKRDDDSPTVSKEARGDLAVAAALNQLGTPFSWGGGSSSGPTRGVGRGAGTTGFDCSGLTLYAWSKAGVKLGHYTGSQFRQGRSVSLADLRRGDLVFFGGGAGDPTHVGLYLGEGIMIHAPRTGDVVRRTSFLQSSHYRPLYRGAVRPG